MDFGVLRGSVVKCLTRSPGVLGSSRTGSSGFFRGSVFGQDTSEPQPCTGETQEDVNNVNSCRDMTEILFEFESNVKHHSINQDGFYMILVIVASLTLYCLATTDKEQIF